QAVGLVRPDSAGFFFLAGPDKIEPPAGGPASSPRRFRTDGTPLDVQEFQVNTYTTNDQALPSGAVIPDGHFVVAWQSFGEDGSGGGIFAQRYDPLGRPLGGEEIVNRLTTNDQTQPAAALDPFGHFAIPWQSVGHEQGSTPPGTA